MEDNKVEYLLLSFIKDSSCMQDGRKIMEELKSQSGISSNSSLEAIDCYKYDLLIRFIRVTHQIGAAQLPRAMRFMPQSWLPEPLLKCRIAS